MNKIEINLNKELRKMPGNLLLVAVIFLFVVIIADYSTIIWMNQIASNSFPGLEYHYNIPDDTINFVTAGLNVFGSVILVLGIWILINLIQVICDVLDHIQNWFYFRKWGGYAV